MPAVLVTIACRDGFALPGRKLSTITANVEKDFLARGWRILIRGPRLFFVCNETGVAYQDVTSKYTLGWSFATDDDLKGTDNYSTPVYTRPPEVATLPVATPDADDLDDDVPVDTIQKGKRR